MAPILRRLVRPALVLSALLVVAAAGAVVGNRVVRFFMGPPLPGPTAVVARLREIQELATAQVVVRTIQRGAARQDGIVTSNTDEILCRLLVTGDYGFDLATIAPERVSVRAGRIAVRLPPPALLAPGFTVGPAELLDSRSTRWVTDAGPGHLSAVQAARGNALSEAPKRIHELGIDREVRETTRSALKRLLPGLLGMAGARVVVDYDDEPEPPEPGRPGGAG